MLELLVRIGVVMACLAATGCKQRAARFHSVREAFYAGDLERARDVAGELQAEGKFDANVARLDQAMIELASGNPRGAESMLRKARDEFDHLQQTDLGETASSLATDDTRLAYAGEGYERILIRAFLAVASLMTDGTDANAYVLQTIAEQHKQSENRRKHIAQVAFAPYLRAALLEEGHSDYEDIERCRVQIADWESDFRDAEADIRRAKFGRHSLPGHGVVYVIGLVGRGPFKVDSVEEPTSQALLIADRLLSAVSDHSLPPTIAPVRVPRIVQDDAGPDAVEVFSAGNLLGTTTTITDIGRLATETWEAERSEVIGRAIVRRVLKKGAIYAAKDRIDSSDPMVELALSLLGVAWEAAEKADTRCWNLLPDRIQVARFELPARLHQLELRAAGGPGQFGSRSAIDVEVMDGRNTWVIATYPDLEPAGPPIASSLAN